MRSGRFQLARSVALLLLALPARAAHGADEDDAAERSFREGRALLREGRVAEGCDKLRASLELKRSPGILLNVASCDRDQGNLLGAVAGFEAARSEAQTYPDAERRQLWISAADDALKQLSPRLAELRLVRPSGALLPSSWSVRLDGAPLTLQKGRARQNPGRHQLEVSAAGHQPLSREVDLAEGEHLTLEIQLEPEAIEQPPPTAASVAPAAGEASTAERETSIVPLALVIGGGALTLAGLSVGVVTWQRKQNLESSCPGPDCDSDEIDDAESLATVADVLVVSGVALGVAGGAWLLWGQSSEPNAQLSAGCTGLASCRAKLTLSF